MRRETSPEDVGGMSVAQGILTATGGKTSHAAVVARGWGKCCIVGAEKLDIDSDAKKMTRPTATSFARAIGSRSTAATARSIPAKIELARPEPPKAYETLMKWADKVRRSACAPTPIRRTTPAQAREMGAEGIGLCRTEHMFFKDFEQPEKSAERQLAIQEMILADTPEARRKALAKLLPFQRRDFIGIFEAMDGFPVTIRLIDPPLHEFVPHDPRKAGGACEEDRRLAGSRGAPRRAIARS